MRIFGCQFLMGGEDIWVSVLGEREDIWVSVLMGGEDFWVSVLNGQR